MYLYRLFGLVVKSDIPLEGCLEIDAVESYDLLLAKGEIPRFEGEMLEDEYLVSCDLRKVCLTIKNKAVFYIEEGCKIVYELKAPSYQDFFVHYLLTFVISIALIQREYLLLHGAIVAKEHMALLIIGQSGAGKSSLTNAFIEGGYDYMSDDVAGISVLEGQTVCYASYPSRRLWDVDVERLDLGRSILKKVPFSVDKYTVADRISYREASTKVAGIIEIVKSDHENNVTIEKVTGIMKNALIHKNMYMYDFIVIGGLGQLFMDRINKICSDIAYYRVIRPALGMSVDEQKALIEKYIRNEGV